MTPTPDFRKEFIEAYEYWYREEQLTRHPDPSEDEVALWAAKWMAERCAKEADIRILGQDYVAREIANKIRQLAHQLEGEK